MILKELLKLVKRPFKKDDYNYIYTDYYNHKEEIDWENVNKVIHLPEEFVNSREEFKYMKPLKWHKLTQWQDVSEDTLRYFSDEIDNWDNISKSKLSEEFIREFQDKLNWYYLSMYQLMTEAFIKEFSDMVNWSYISRYQILSEGFIKEFEDMIDFERPNIMYDRDIKPKEPCKEAAERYLSVWGHDEEITWNEFLKKYPGTRSELLADIHWLVETIEVT